MPSYVFTYRQPKGQPLNMEAADAWFKWFDEIGEHITQQGSAVSTARQLGNCEGGQSISGFTVISARDLDHAAQLADLDPLPIEQRRAALGELLEIPAAA
jgi:hypothetical protein